MRRTIQLGVWGTVVALSLSGFTIPLRAAEKDSTKDRSSSRFQICFGDKTP
jgi:hypothetical protein